MGEELAEAADRLIVKGIAFGRTVEGEDADLAVASEAEGVREVDGRRLGGCLGRVGSGEVGHMESLNMSSEEERAPRLGGCVVEVAGVVSRGHGRRGGGGWAGRAG